MSGIGNAIVAQPYQLHHVSPHAVRIAIVTAEWNSSITHPLRDGAVQTLLQAGLQEKQIECFSVPGAFELSYGAAKLMARTDFDAIIVFGCVIRGETSHYEHICDGVTKAITELNLLAKIPVIFGLITTENMQQAQDRIGGKEGHKGVEAAFTALRMIDFSYASNSRHYAD